MPPSCTHRQAKATRIGHTESDTGSSRRPKSVGVWYSLALPCGSGHDLDILIDFTIHDLLAHGQSCPVKPGLRLVFVDLAAHKTDQLADGFDHIGAVALVLLDIAEVHVFHAVATAPWKRLASVAGHGGREL